MYYNMDLKKKKKKKEWERKKKGAHLRWVKEELSKKPKLRIDKATAAVTLALAHREEKLSQERARVVAAIPEAHKSKKYMLWRRKRSSGEGNEGR